MKQNKKDILDKLKDGDTGFSIPKNYFDQFETDLRENKSDIKSGFTAPEDYFDQVEESILLRLNMKVTRSTGFKTPDSIQLATALYSGSDIFYTNDKRLSTFSDIKILTIEEG